MLGQWSLSQLPLSAEPPAATPNLFGGALVSTLAIGALTGVLAVSGVALTSTLGVGQELGTESDSGVAIVSTLAVGAMSGKGALSGAALASTLSTGALSGAAPLSGVALSQALSTGAMSGAIPLSGIALAGSLATGLALDGSIPPPVPVSVSPSGGWPLYVYLENQTYQRRLAHERSRQLEREALEAAQNDAVQAEIASRLHAELARQEELNELQRLRVLVSKHSELVGVPESVQRAFLRARAEASFSRLQALQREFAKSLDEEELALLMILLEEG